KNISPQSSRRQIKHASHNRSQSHSSNDSTLFSIDPPKQRWIQVTNNMKTFIPTNITDLEDLNSIKDTIFSQLGIDFNEKEDYTIHVLTKFGLLKDKDLGAPISDLDLMQKCMNTDDRGDLKLLVKRKQLQNEFSSIAEDPQDMNRLRYHRRQPSGSRISGSPPQDLTSQDNEIHYYDDIHRNTALVEFQNENHLSNRIDYNWNGGTSPRLQRSHPAILQPANGAIRRHTSREHISQAPMSIPSKTHTVPQPHNQSQYYGVGPYNQYPNKYSKSQPHLPVSQNALSMNLHEMPENESPYVHKRTMSSEPDLTLRKPDIPNNIVFPDSVDEKPLWPKLTDSSSTRIEEEISIWAKPPKPTNPSRSSNVSSPVDTSHQITDKNDDRGRLLSKIQNINNADEESVAQIHKRSSFKQSDNQVVIDRNPANIERQNNLPENGEPNNKVNKVQSITSQSQQLKKRHTGGLARTVSKRRGVKAEESWIERPTAEDIFEDIEQYFPNHDVDMPIVDAHVSAQNSAPSDEPLPRTTPVSAIPEKSGVTISRVKSIRVVAREARERERTNRKSVEATTVKEGKLSRRPTTKLWNMRVVEQIPAGKKAPCISGSDEDCTEKKRVKWVKGRLIGKGNFGKVYLALNLSSSEVVAVKQIEQPLTPSDKRNERHKVQIKSFKDEMEILKDLDHEHIVSYIGYEENEENINIFLEYVNGGSIGTVLRSNGPFKEPVVRSFTRQILDGLKYLHGKNILHRDIKADNILVDEDGCCKISDFGISKRSDAFAYDNKSNMTLQGTIFWMAPEVFTNGYSAKVDIWGLGCVVLEMFTDERPWAPFTDVTAMFKIGSEKKAPPIREDVKESISKEAQDFLNQCFIIDPSLRPTAEKLLEHPFAQEDSNFNFKDYIKIPNNNNTVSVIPEDHESTDEFFDVPHIVFSGETITSAKYTQKAGGKGANQSVAIAKAGARVWHVGKIGHDGIWIKEYMESQLVNVDNIIISKEQPTGRAIIQLSQDTRDNAIILLPGTNHLLSEIEAQEVLAQGFGKGDWSVFQNEIGLIGGKILKLCKNLGLTTVLNAAPISEDITKIFSFDLVDYLIVNQLEATQLYRQIFAISVTIELSSTELLNALSNEFPQLIGIIITLGSDGLVAWFGPEKRVYTLPAFKTTLCDTTGAGDAFTGYFIASLARNQLKNEQNISIDVESFILPTAEQFLDSLKEAIVAAGLAVSKYGTMESFPYLEEVKEKLEYF
ncbi:23894_t:CDS:10, partial [Cetraspora pellucida]